MSIPPKLAHLLVLAFPTLRPPLEIYIHFFTPPMRLPFQRLRHFPFQLRFDTARYHRFHRFLHLLDQFVQVFFPFLPFVLL
jgi:hypothetical protein